ncbi:MAG TPA: hypothetical protein VNY52_12060 [Solirubrobacteraceae bacterium]|jgi:hypothetical protein|nr:hypothetical protein [Solirubrobacteraceae bacterium]
MRIVGHGRSIGAPEGWEARIFRRGESAPVLHVATFPLEDGDGDFGAAATGRMRPDDAFASLVEYRGDAVVRPGHGLFAPAGRPVELRASDFQPNQLQVTRPGQLGCQRFFTAGGRPLCLYAVIHPEGRSRAQLARDLSEVLRTLRFEPR